MKLRWKSSTGMSVDGKKIITEYRSSNRRWAIVDGGPAPWMLFRLLGERSVRSEAFDSLRAAKAAAQQMENEIEGVPGADA